MSSSQRPTDAFPRWPVLRAELLDLPGNTAAVTLTFPDGNTEPFSAPDRGAARAWLIAAARRYLKEHVKQPGRLSVTDPEREWVLGIPLEEDADPVILEQRVREPEPRPQPAAVPDPPQNAEGRPEAAEDRPEAADDSPAPRGDAPQAAGRPETAPAPTRVAAPTRAPGRFSVGRIRRDDQSRLEEELDRELAQERVLKERNRIVITSIRGGVGKSTNAIQIGACLATHLPGRRIAALDFNLGGGALGAEPGSNGSGEGNVAELRPATQRVASHTRLQPRVATLLSGLDLITVPFRPELALELTPGHYEELLADPLIQSYDLLLLDCAPDITSPVTRWALQRGTQLVVSTEQGHLTGSVVQHALDYLLAQPAAAGGKGAMAVINKVVNDPRAGSADATEDSLRSANADMPIVRIPLDLDMRALIASGHYSTELVKRRSTRVPVKELAVEVLRRLA